MYIDRITAIVAVSALALSVLSPLITACISGHYSLKLQKEQFQHDLDVRNAEFYTRHRAEVIERFITAAGAMIEWNDVTTAKNFGSSLGEIYLYVSPKLWQDIDDLRDAMRTSADKARDQYVDLCKLLRREAVRKEDKDQ